MKNILVPYSDDPATRVAIDMACQLARRYGSLIEILRAIEPPHVIINDIVPAAYVTQLHEQQQVDADSIKQSFQTLCEELDLPISEQPGNTKGMVATWTEMNGREDFIVGDYGRLFDLIAVARRPSRVGGDWTTTLEAALFESGRPVLLAPPELDPNMGQNVVIAWNGSTETAHTVALAMPLLTAANTVTLLSIEGASVPGPTGEQMANRLKRHGINALTVHDEAQGRLAGEAILYGCQQLGANMLVKGAYTHSRLRQLIFGGATQHIILNAELPVFMAH